MATTCQEPTTFLDLCAAGAPLAAITRCLRCEDQVQLAHAVGKAYRRAVLREITRLPALRLHLAGRGATQAMGVGTCFLQQLENVNYVRLGHVRAQLQGMHDLRHVVEGLPLLRLLPQLRTLDVSTVSGLSPAEDLGISKCLAALTSLERLDVPGLFFYGPATDVEEGARHLANLSNLTWLDVTRFPMTLEGVRHIATGLKALRELHVAYCDLEGADVSPLTNLTYLDVSNCNVDEQAILHIGALHQLRDLELEHIVWHADVDPAWYAHLSSLSALMRLNLGHNALSEEATSALPHLQSLTILDLSNCFGMPISALAPLQRIASLQTLDCSCCVLDSYKPLGAEGAMHIGKCTQLRDLLVESGAIGDEGARHLANLTGLLRLCINPCDVGAAGVSHLAQHLTNLTRLEVWANHLGAEGAAHIARMTQLQSLDIARNGLGVEGVQALAANLQALRDIRFHSFDRARQPAPADAKAGFELWTDDTEMPNNATEVFQQLELLFPCMSLNLDAIVSDTS